MSPGDERITVYYNSACPVCDAGIHAQQGRAAGCGVAYVDVHSRNAAVAEVGATLEQVREKLHVVDATGHVLVGAPAAAALMRQTRGLRWLGRIADWPGLRVVASASYDLLASVLYRWNVRRGSW